MTNTTMTLIWGGATALVFIGLVARTRGLWNMSLFSQFTGITTLFAGGISFDPAYLVITKPGTGILNRRNCNAVRIN